MVPLYPGAGKYYFILCKLYEQIGYFWIQGNECDTLATDDTKKQSDTTLVNMGFRSLRTWRTHFYYLPRFKNSLFSRSIQGTGSNIFLTQESMYNLKLTGQNKRQTKPAFIFKRSKLSKFNTCFEETRLLKYTCNVTISKWFQDKLNFKTSLRSTCGSSSNLTEQIVFVLKDKSQIVISLKLLNITVIQANTKIPYQTRFLSNTLPTPDRQNHSWSKAL